MVNSRPAFEQVEGLAVHFTDLQLPLQHIEISSCLHLVLRNMLKRLIAATACPLESYRLVGSFKPMQHQSKQLLYRACSTIMLLHLHIFMPHR